MIGYSPSLPVRGAWIEIPSPADIYGRPASLPVRGAWIEIRQNTGMHVSEQIAPCEAGQLLDD